MVCKGHYRMYVANTHLEVIEAALATGYPRLINLYLRVLSMVLYGNQYEGFSKQIAMHKAKMARKYQDEKRIFRAVRERNRLIRDFEVGSSNYPDIVAVQRMRLADVYFGCGEDQKALEVATQIEFNTLNVSKLLTTFSELKYLLHVITGLLLLGSFWYASFISYNGHLDYAMVGKSTKMILTFVLFSIPVSLLSIGVLRCYGKIFRQLKRGGLVPEKDYKTRAKAIIEMSKAHLSKLVWRTYPPYYFSLFLISVVSYSAFTEFKAFMSLPYSVAVSAVLFILLYLNYTIWDATFAYLKIFKPLRFRIESLAIDITDVSGMAGLGVVSEYLEIIFWYALFSMFLFLSLLSLDRFSSYISWFCVIYVVGRGALLAGVLVRFRQLASKFRDFKKEFLTSYASLARSIPANVKELVEKQLEYNLVMLLKSFPLRKRVVYRVGGYLFTAVLLRKLVELAGNYLAQVFEH